MPLSLKNLGWKKFDVTESVEQWFTSDSGEKMRLLVDCSGCGTLIETVAFNQNDEPTSDHAHQDNPEPKIPSSLVPFLVVHTEPNISHRVRRRAMDCGRHVTQCCKQKLYISFEKLGWDDWIIYPSGYFANYCTGDCSNSYRTPDSYINFYTHVLEEYRRLKPYVGITPCCAPTKLSPISLIYFDQDLNIIKRDLPKMTVDECGCA